MNKKSGKIYKVLIVAMLVLSILVTTSGCTALSSYNYGNRNVKFSEMTYTRPDTTAFYSYADTAVLLCNNPIRIIPLIKALNGMSSEMIYFSSMHTLNEIYCAIDYTDEECAQESVYLAVEYARMYARYMSVLQTVLESKSGFICESLMDQQTIADIKEYVPPEDDRDELLEREEELTNQYFDVYYNQYNDDPAKKAEEIGKIFIELINIRKELYVTAQYDDVIDYYYSLFYRDYTYEEAHDYCEYVKEYIAPVYAKYKAEYKELCYSDMFDKNEKYTGEEALDSIQEGMGKIDKNLEDVFRYMREYELCNVKSSDKKEGTSFTTYILGYDEPYMLITPDGTIEDYMSIIHEFGHYYEMYEMYDYSSTIDVKEIHSQGMEVLYTGQYKDVFGEELSEKLLKYRIYELMYATIIGCVFEEFQEYAYTTENVTPEMLNDRYATLLYEYGLVDKTAISLDYDAYGTAWISVPHTFQVPFYYISYSVSAIQALYIYEVATEQSYEDAYDVYMNVVSYGSDYGFKELTHEADLVNIFSEAEVREFAEFLGNLF